MDAADEIERLRSLFSAAEPDLGGGRFLIVPSEDQVYAAGTVLPIIGTRPPHRAEGSGLRLPGSAPAHFDYIGTYLTVREYFPADELPAPIDDLLQVCADFERRYNLIRALAVINARCKRQGGFNAIAAEYRAPMSPGMRERFDAAMRADTGGLGRLVVAPQPLLLGLRWLLGRPPASEPIGAAPSEATQSRAILFTHLLGATLRDPSEARQLTIEERQRLMLALINLGSLSESRDIYSAIDRTFRLWREYGHIAAKRLDATADALLKRFTGAELVDFVAVGFALLAHVMAWEPGQPFLLNPTIHDGAAQAPVEAVLKVLGHTLEEAQAHLRDPRSEFDVLAIEARPVLVEPGGLLVLDQDLLWRRCTSGLYWVVHDAVKAADGEGARHQWTMAFAEMVEALTEDMLRPLAPRVLGTDERTFFTEEDFERAFGGIARCDAGIDFGDTFLLVEVVSGQLTVQSRVDGDLAKLEKDFDRLVFDKCRQLDSTALAILANEERLTGIPTSRRTLNIVPSLVVGGGFALNHLSYGYIRSKLEQLKLLTDPRVAGLAILDLEDVEVLEALGETGHNPSTVLLSWQQSELADLPLHNFLLRAGLIGSEPLRPRRMQRTVDDAFEEVIARLGFPPRDDLN